MRETVNTSHRPVTWLNYRGEVNLVTPTHNRLQEFTIKTIDSTLLRVFRLKGTHHWFLNLEGISVQKTNQSGRTLSGPVISALNCPSWNHTSSSWLTYHQLLTDIPPAPDWHTNSSWLTYHHLLTDIPPAPDWHITSSWLTYHQLLTSCRPSDTVTIQIAAAWYAHTKKHNTEWRPVACSNCKWSGSTNTCTMTVYVD